jgi:prevent-host-death family protein
MGSHSVADAKNRLSELIDLALKGEGVVITRHGTPVVELKPVPELPRRMTDADVDRLIANRVGKDPPTIDAGKFVREMRDED